MKKYAMHGDTSPTEQFEIWQQIYNDFNFGNKFAKEAAYMRALDELDFIIKGFLTQARNAIGLVNMASETLEALEQSLKTITWLRLPLYNPYCNGNRTLGSSFFFPYFQDALNNWKLGGDGFNPAPQSKYIAKTHGIVSTFSYEEMTSNPNSTLSMRYAKSAEEDYFERETEKLADDAEAFIKTFPAQERKKAAALFAFVRMASGE